MNATPVVLHNPWALGDTICISAAVRDLHRAHPGKFRVMVSGHYLGYWKRCPHVYPLDPHLQARRIMLDYKPGIRASKDGRYRQHFLTWFHKILGESLQVQIPVTEPRGEIFAAPTRPAPAGRYWVVVAGGKLDMTTKLWVQDRWQAVVDQLAARGMRTVQAGAHFNRHVHYPLKRCEQALGKTDDIHDLFELIRCSEGVICGITGAMHIAAAYEKPCVVLAGGREEPSWESYTNAGQWPRGCPPVRVPHRYLHTIGALECCKEFGCWRDRTVAIEKVDSTTAGRDRLCKQPLSVGGQPVAACMALINVEHTLGAVMSYYENGTLPPMPPGSIVEPEPPQVPEKALTPGPRLIPAYDRLGPDPWKALDHPHIGGRFTVFMLAHGDYFEFSKRALDSVLATIPPGRMDLRVALNQPGPATEQAFLSCRGITKLYADYGSRRKYPAMRAMFNDPELPITTPYIVWLDDDIWAVDPLWAVKLAESISTNHDAGCRLYGAVWIHDLTMYRKHGHRPEEWFRQAPWWRGRDLFVGRGERTAPNGSAIRFASGWLWALATDTMREAGIPDRRLNHNGGDIVVGAQVHQAGYRVKMFNENKSLVACPPRDQGGRRGYSEPFPWEPRA